MDEGWIVLNLQNVVVDANPAAELIIGMSREKAYGQPLTSILSDLSGLGHSERREAALLSSSLSNLRQL